MFSGHSAAQEIKHAWKLTSGFIGPKILNFERSLRLTPGPQSSLVPSYNIWLGGPADINFLLVVCSYYPTVPNTIYKLVVRVGY
jgi:hypothetical protein